MKRIGIIGAGGIGSFFIRELSQLYLNSVTGLGDIEVTIIDGDEVEEKNLRYQNFEVEDLGKAKAESMSERYLFQSEVKFIKNVKELYDFDIVIIAVDNGKARDLVYNYCKDKDKYFIDMRSEGRGFAVYTKEFMDKQGFNKLKETYDVEKPATSCQLKFELENGTIQLGNRMVAMIGLQMLLNHLRGETNITDIIQRI